MSGDVLSAVGNAVHRVTHDLVRSVPVAMLIVAGYTAVRTSHSAVEATAVVAVLLVAAVAWTGCTIYVYPRASR